MSIVYASVLASEGELVRELPASPATFGVLTFIVLGFGLWFVLQWNKER